MCCCCFVALLGVGLWQGDFFKTTPPVTSDDSIVIGEKDYIDERKEDNTEVATSGQTISKELQEKIDELQSVAGDILGWVVYGDRLYMQNANIDIANIKPNMYLGRASEFRGAYQNEDACDGDVYNVADNPDLILIKLDNGGEVILGVDD